MNTFSKIALSALVALGAAACQPGGADHDKLDKLTAKIDSLDKKIDDMGKRGPAGAAPTQRPSRPAPQPGVVYAIPVDDSDPSKGPKHAKVTIVEAYEYACPYCSMAAEIIDGVLAKYPNDVRLVSKQFVVHPQTATDASLGACAATRQGKFAAWDKAMWTKVWVKKDGRPSMVSQMLQRDALDKIAAEIGLDMNRFKADLAGDCRKMLDKHRTEMATFGVSGTPAIFVNGQIYRGQRTVEALSAFVDAEIKKADEALGKGTKLEDYYASVVVKGGKKSLQ